MIRFHTYLFPGWRKVTWDFSPFACLSRSMCLQRCDWRHLQRSPSDDSLTWKVFHMFNITWQLTTGQKDLKTLQEGVCGALYSLWMGTSKYFDFSTEISGSSYSSVFSLLFFCSFEAVFLLIYCGNDCSELAEQKQLFWITLSVLNILKRCSCTWKAK